jgi:hypothetical protein
VLDANGRWGAFDKQSTFLIVVEQKLLLYLPLKKNHWYTQTNPNAELLHTEHVVERKWHQAMVFWIVGLPLVVRRSCESIFYPCTKESDICVISPVNLPKFLIYKPQEPKLTASWPRVMSSQVDSAAG